MNTKIIKTLTLFVALFLVTLLLLPNNNQQNSEVRSDKDDIAVMKKDTSCFSPTINKEQESPLRIVGLGDSLTAGVGDEKDEGGYIGKLEKKLSAADCPVSVTKYSKKGLHTRGLLQSLQDEKVSTAIANAHIVLFTIGANDLVTIAKKERLQFTETAIKKAEQQYAKNIEETLTKIRALNEDVQVYLVGFYNPISEAIINDEQIDSLVTKWNNISENHTNQMDDTHFVRIDDMFTDKINRYLADDNFHLNHLGYEKVAERLINMIRAEGD